ncbi:unnamed protein product [Polarella glacialis]|uniref:Ion transport domain-containing protein n=1 Tax=Polarella glacialis TaxID=89957 RepID=A0A813GQL6_POLGL|nr:unnamed protein product [Polarella glacialis]
MARFSSLDGDASSSLNARIAALILQDIDRLAEKHRREMHECLQGWLVKEQQSALKVELDMPTSELQREAEPFKPREDPPCKPIKGTTVAPQKPEGDPPTAEVSTLLSLDDVQAIVPSKSRQSIRTGSVIVSNQSELACLPSFTKSRFYESASVVLILLNALLIGVSCQVTANLAKQSADMNLPAPGEPPVLTVLGAVFNIIFLIDLILRWASVGFGEFFRGRDVSWNIFDVFIVLMGIIDVLLEIVSVMGGFKLSNGSLSSLRVLRVCRIVRIIKVIRVLRFFRELRIMISSILHSGKSLMWIFFVLGTLFFLFGISFTQATIEYLDRPEMWHDPGNAQLIEKYSSLGSSITTLYMSMSGGVSWGEAYFCLEVLPLQYSFLFLVYITGTIFAVLNVVTGVFVESATSFSRADAEALISDEMHQKIAYLDSMKDLFHEMDEENTGLLTWQSFQEHLASERVVSYLSALKLDVKDARKLFTVLDHHHRDAISLDEFMTGCYDVHGEASNLDAKIMQLQVDHVRHQLKKVVQMLIDLTEGQGSHQHHLSVRPAEEASVFPSGGSESQPSEDSESQPSVVQ